MAEENGNAVSSSYRDVVHFAVKSQASPAAVKAIFRVENPVVDQELQSLHVPLAKKNLYMEYACLCVELILLRVC